MPNLTQLVYKEFKESLIYSVLVTNQEEYHAKSIRLKELEKSLRTDHLNSVEKESLMIIFQEYSDLFFLKGD